MTSHVRAHLSLTSHPKAHLFLTSHADAYRTDVYTAIDATFRPLERISYCEGPSADVGHGRAAVSDVACGRNRRASALERLLAVLALRRSGVTPGVSLETAWVPGGTGPFEIFDLLFFVVQFLFF